MDSVGDTRVKSVNTYLSSAEFCSNQEKKKTPNKPRHLTLNRFLRESSKTFINKEV